jgi:DNA-binding transcriptional MerR regulator
MLMAELSRRSGVPVATVKYYLREALLPPGAATSATRAEYSEAHLRRLRLIRALLDIGEIPLAAIRKILAVVDDQSASVHEMLGAVQYGLGPHPAAPAEQDAEEDQDWQAASRQVDELIASLGWIVAPTAAARTLLAGTLAALRQGRPRGAGRVRRGRHGPARARHRGLAPAGPGGRLGPLFRLTAHAPPRPAKHGPDPSAPALAQCDQLIDRIGPHAVLIGQRPAAHVDDPGRGRPQRGQQRLDRVGGRLGPRVAAPGGVVTRGLAVVIKHERTLCGSPNQPARTSQPSRNLPLSAYGRKCALRQCMLIAVNFTTYRAINDCIG